MLVRYKQDDKGKSVAFADIYSPNEHHIDPSLIDKDAVWAIRKLKASGAEAYIVGGAVRDLLLGLVPKDFDITTSASPRQIQRLFWNARVIGRRFKLVHLVFGPKIIEVSTFRSGEEAEDGNNNVFGSVDQDAKRRDFSINSLYYDPTNGQLLDFNHAMADFKKKRITSIIPLDKSFVEDPVRMIRAVKYSVTTGFSLRFDIKMAIRKYATELSRTSTSRLTEEVNKILASGRCCDIFLALEKYKLLVYMLPCFSVYCKFDKEKKSLRELDRMVNLAKQGKGAEVTLAEQLKFLVTPLVVFTGEEQSGEDRFHEAYRQIKVLVSPMTPPNYEVENAAMRILADQGYKLPRMRSRQAGRPQQARSAMQRRRPAPRRPRPNTARRKEPQKVVTVIETDAKNSAEAHDL
jgi:poly(A) polymerase